MPWRTDSAPDISVPDTHAPPPTGDEHVDEGVMSWDEICHSDAYRGRWVALDACRYDAASGRATAGQVVDVDDDLHELCLRVREEDRRSCAIVFCAPGRSSFAPN